MFKPKKENEAANIDKTVNRISLGTIVSGDIKAETDLRIDGRVSGNVISSSKVIIGIKGELVGDLTCSEASIEGIMKGNVTVAGLLRLNANSRIDGDVHYKKIIIEEGAIIIGSLNTQSAISIPISSESKKMKEQSTNMKIG